MKINFWNSLKEVLIKSSASASQKNYFFLSTDLLKSEFIHSLTILEDDGFALPALEIPRTREKVSRVLLSDPVSPLTLRVKRIQHFYKNHRYRECLVEIQRFFHFQRKVKYGLFGSSFHLGFRMMEINSYIALGYEEKAVTLGISLINEILNNNTQVGYRQNQFFLNEIITALSSTENLSKQMRDYLWDINLRINSFFSNTDKILDGWNLDADFLTQISGKSLTEGIIIFYLEGNAYIKIQFPWIDSRSQVIAKINESKLVDIIHSKTIENPKGPWKNIAYAIYNLNNFLIDGPFGTKDKLVEIDRRLNSNIAQWRLEVFKSLNDERLSLGKRKVLLLSILTGFSILILVLGVLTGIKGIIDEKKMVALKTNFLSAVTHELKTPLTSIRLLSELVESGKQADRGRIKKYANLIGQESTRLQGMIDNILSSTRMENKNIAASMKTMDLIPVVEEVIQLMTNNYKEKGITLIPKLTPKALVKGDLESLRSVIQNLLENALKYSPSGARVTITCEILSGEVIFSVKDTGIGISPAAQKHIFDKFYRAEDEMTRKSKGTGLGLALVKQILDYHKAKVEVESREGAGTEFIIYFPQAKMDEEGA